MDAVIQHFRTALSGFNRQDVQDYMEQLVNAHRQELEELKKRLEAEEGRAARLEEDVSRLQGVEEELARVREEREDASRQAARLTGELSQSESKLSVARQELERLRKQVSALTPLADAYQEFRDRAARVELEAHQRAQSTEQEARRRAREMVSEAQAESERVRSEARAESERLRSEAQAESERLRGEAQTESERVRSEARSWLAQVMERYDRLREDLGGLVEQARKVNGGAEELEQLDESSRRLREQGGLE